MRVLYLTGVLLSAAIAGSCEFFVRTWFLHVELNNDQKVVVGCNSSSRESIWYRPTIETDEPLKRCIAACEAHGFQITKGRVHATAYYEGGGPDVDVDKLPLPCR